MQQNALTNNCGGGGGRGPPNCSWWIQSVIQFTNPSTGVWKLDLALIEIWDGSQFNNVCQINVQGPNIDQKGWSDVEQTTIYTGQFYSLNFQVHAYNAQGGLEYSNNADCVPSNGQIFTMNQLEGVMVGPGGGNYGVFGPQSSNPLFRTDNVELSDFNELSNELNSTQTGEGSDLIENNLIYLSDKQGSQYFYDVQTDQQALLEYLAMNSAPGITISPSSGWYPLYAQIQISASYSCPYGKSGYIFDGWTGSGSGQYYTGPNEVATVQLTGSVTESALSTFYRTCPENY